MDLRGVRVLVTGGAGFIGSHTARALLDQGAEVHIVDNLCTGRRENIPDGTVFHETSTADRELATLLGDWRPQVIYHFAFNVLVPQAVEDPRMDLEGVEGSINVLELARTSGVSRVVFASSGFVYGNTERLPATEAEPVIPVSPYVVSKHAVEGYLDFYRRAYGLPYVVLRYSAVYGSGQVTGAMADYVRRLRAGDQADIWGDGTKTRDYVFIDDVVRANLLALDAPSDLEPSVLNIGTGIETTLNELYARIAALLDREAVPRYHPDRPGEQLRYSLDASRARDVLGWLPTVDLEEGLRRIVAGLSD